LDHGTIIKNNPKKCQEPIGPPGESAAYWTTKEKQETHKKQRILHFPVHGKMSEMVQKRFRSCLFLAHMFGRIDFDFDNFHLLDFLDPRFQDFPIPRFLDFPIPGFPHGRPVEGQGGRRMGGRTDMQTDEQPIHRSNTSQEARSPCCIRAQCYKL